MNQTRIGRRSRPIVAAVSVTVGAVAWMAAPAAAAIPAPGAALAGSPPPAERFFTGVSCPSATVCMVVGYNLGPSDAASPLSETWNGTTWRVLATPSRLPGASLTAVSCPSSTRCLAVGDDPAGDPIFDAWNGTAWQTLPPPAAPARETLTALACTSPSRCIAVGDGQTGSLADGAIAEQWNGAAWTALPVIVPPGAVSSSFAGISCPAANACMATGRFNTASGTFTVHTLAESWDGSTWTLLGTTDPQNGPHAFGAVSCTSATACMAAGFAVNPSVEVWDGSTWSVLTMPAPQTFLPLDGLWCTSPASCMVVGGEGTSLFADRWNGGTSWTQLPIPSPSGGETHIAGLACAGPARCLAVGSEGSLGSFAGFAEAWDGSRWRPARTHQVESLTGISCPTISRCLTAGSYLSTSDDIKTLAEAWNGTTWRLANRPGLGGFIVGVSCVSSSFCMGTGQFGGSDSATWDGTRWTPVKHSRTNQQVSCATASFCMTNGGGGGRSQGTTFVWRGTGWSPVPFPVPADAASAGLTVSCTSPARCLGAGAYYYDPETGFPDFTLAEAWNGTRWRILPSPDPGQSRYFSLVSCVPRSGCMAAGTYTGAQGARHNFAAWWNGKKWRLLAMPGRVGISGLSCARATSCMAVGPHLAARWNGRTWRRTRTGGRSFSDVSCPAPRRCIAIGQAGLLTLIERWNGTRWRRLTSVNP